MKTPLRINTPDYKVSIWLPNENGQGEYAEVMEYDYVGKRWEGHVIIK